LGQSSGQSQHYTTTALVKLTAYGYMLETAPKNPKFNHNFQDDMMGFEIDPLCENLLKYALGS